MIWATLRAVVYGGLTVAQAVADTYDRAKRIGRALLPRRREDAFPLTHRDAERQAQFARCAGHESEPRCSTIRPTIRPGPPDPPRGR